MGVIARQGSKHFIVSLLTMGVGVFNNFYIYPQFWAAYGFIQAFKSIGDLILPFAMLGLRPVLIKFKYHFTSNGNNVFLFGLIWFLISSSLVILLLVLFQNLLLDKLSGHIPNLELVKDYGFEIIVSIYLFGIVTLLSTISLINKRIVVPSIIKDLIIAKIGIPIVILSSAYYSFSDTGLIWMYIGLLSCLVFMLLIYNFKNRFITYSKLVLRTFNKEKGKILNFGLYSVLDSAGAKLAFGIDIIMINLLLGNEATGVYAVFLFLSRVVKIPLTSIDSIANPVISQFWTANNTKGINDLYKKSGVTILSVSLGIFLLIYLSLDDILIIMDKVHLIEAKYIFLFIAGSMVINGVTSVNSPILAYSKHYKWNLLFILLLSGLNILLTYYFITSVFKDPFRSAGAACSTAIALILYNLLKLGFIFFKFNMHPFSKNILWVSALGLLSYFLFRDFTFFMDGWLSIIVRSLFFSLFYASILYFSKIAPDLNMIIDQNISRFKNYKV